MSMVPAQSLVIVSVIQVMWDTSVSTTAHLPILVADMESVQPMENVSVMVASMAKTVLWSVADLERVYQVDIASVMLVMLESTVSLCVLDTGAVPMAPVPAMLDGEANIVQYLDVQEKTLTVLVMESAMLQFINATAIQDGQVMTVQNLTVQEILTALDMVCVHLPPILLTASAMLVGWDWHATWNVFMGMQLP